MGKRQPIKAPSENVHAGRQDCRSDLRGDCTVLAVARTVLERARELFSQRVSDLTKCGAELEWADLSVAKRMVRATNVDVKQAVDMFVQALELRARHRELLRTMQCQTFCDIRVFARDVQDHPVIYMCARSLTVSLGSIREQFMIAFEAACRLTTKEGTVSFVVDMWGMRPRLLMDYYAVKDLTDTLGTVYAERIHRIIVVDFARAGQAGWMMLKPMLRQKTRDKYSFIGNAEARELSREMFSPNDHEKLCKTLDVNRDPESTCEERAVQARRTTACDVPLGPALK